MQKEKLLRDLISLAYHEAIGSVCRPALLERLAELLDGAGACFSTYDFLSGAGAIRSAAGLNPNYVESYASHYAALNPWLRDERHYRPPGAIVTGRKVITHRELIETRFYNDWLKPQGFFHRIAGVLTRDGDSVAYFELLRPKAGRCFGRRELVLFGRVLPHLQQAFHIHRTMHRLQAERDAAQHVLDRLPFGVVLVDRAVQPLAANAYASKLLAESDGLALLGRNGLCAASLDETTCLRNCAPNGALLATGGSEKPGGTMMVSRSSGHRPLQVLVSPLSTTDGPVDNGGPAAVLFVADPDHKVEVDQETLRQLFALTPAEARLAALIAQGEPLAGAARATGVTVGTARTHLKRIFAKTGTERQAQLVSLLLSGPAQIRAH